MSAWQLVPNLDWRDRTPPPEPFSESACCDRSHFVTIACRCGEQMHMHESKTRDLSPEARVLSTCKGCGEVFVFPPKQFSQAFEELRRSGWIR